jgi:hypothetical protein
MVCMERRKQCACIQVIVVFINIDTRCFCVTTINVMGGEGTQKMQEAVCGV